MAARATRGRKVEPQTTKHPKAVGKQVVKAARAAKQEAAKAAASKARAIGVECSDTLHPIALIGGNRRS